MSQFTHHNSKGVRNGGDHYGPPGCTEDDFRQRIRQRFAEVRSELARASDRHGLPLSLSDARLESSVFAKACEDCRGLVPEGARDIFHDEVGWVER